MGPATASLTDAPCLRHKGDRRNAVLLEITASDNPKELIDRLTDINVYLARSGKLLADAKAYQDQVTANVYASHMEFISRVPATVAMKFVAAQSVTANQIVTWLDRINRTLVHA